MTQPRFVNLDSHPVIVRDPQGHQRTVRPYRELQAFAWRKPEDCVCEGEHYASFPGLLSPFPEPEQPAAPAAPAAPASGAGVAANAHPGRYKATGDVVRPDGTVKQDAPAPVAAPAAPVAPVSEPVAPEPTPEPDGDEGDPNPDEGGQDPVEDDEPDRPLEDVPGVTKKLAAALKKAGYGSAVALANCQDPKALTKLSKVAGVKDAAALAEAAQELLGWEEVDEDEGEDDGEDV